MKLPFLFVILIGLLKPNFSLDQTQTGGKRVARSSEVDGKSLEDESEGIKEAKCDPQSVADLVFAKLKIEMDQQTAVMNRMNVNFARSMSDLKDHVNSKESYFTEYIEGAIRDNDQRHRAMEAMLYVESKEIKESFSELKKIVVNMQATLNKSISSVESTEIRTQIMIEDLKTISIQVKELHLDPVQKTLTNVDDNIVNLNNAFTSAKNETQFLLLKSLKEMIDMESTKTGESLLELKEIVIGLKETLNDSISSVESAGNKTHILFEKLQRSEDNKVLDILQHGKNVDKNTKKIAEDLQILSTRVKTVTSKLEPFHQALTNVDANVVNLSNAYTSGENKTYALLLKVLEDSTVKRMASKNDDSLSLLQQKMNNLHEIAHWLRSNATVESKKLEELIYKNGRCYMSSNLNITRLSNGQQYYFSTKFLKWQQAKEFCEQLGMTMVTLDTKDEFEVVASHNPGEDYWVSANDVGRGHGNFYWANDVKVDNAMRLNLNNSGLWKDTCLDLYGKRLRDFPCSNNGGNVLCKRPSFCKMN